MKYNNIKWILRQQIKVNSQRKWAWIEDENEFVCIYNIIPDVKHLYTAQQLLNKLNSI